MARKIVFVIDISGSMSGQQKLVDARAAFAAMIETLEERDTLYIQTFSNSGTEDLWGPQAATSSAKNSASRFVSALSAFGGTNLNDAFLDGLASSPSN
jgi:Mg-chelatase subunit ChlD